jgi:hypothetical protein
VRGTSFLIAYDSSSDATGVVGIEGRIMVRSLAEVLNNGVYVTASEATSRARHRADQAEPVDPDYMMHESRTSCSRSPPAEPVAAGEVAGSAGGREATCRRRIRRPRRADSPVRSVATSCATRATSPANRPPSSKTLDAVSSAYPEHTGATRVREGC